jgi:hypothetical protein
VRAVGRDLCHALRGRGIQTPVLFLTARDAVRGSAGERNGKVGAGLGRALARSVDGDVNAENDLDGGRFVVRLPVG